MTIPIVKNTSYTELAVDYSYFITIRIADSLPLNVIQQLKDDYQYRVSIIEKELPEQKDALIHLERKKYFGKFDHQLDQSMHSNSIFHQSRAANILKEILHEKDEDWYHLHAYSILPNHVHLLLDTSCQKEEEIDVNEILSHIKKKSSFKIQNELNLQDSIWQYENYYHKIPSVKEWMNIASYILTNPVKADLCNTWDKWEHSYLRE